MQDHGDLVYLDVPKTGSTFVAAFLKEACRLPLLGGMRHARIIGPYRPDAYYFATVRHPLAQYESLFRYGCGHRGGIWARLSKFGRADLYEKGLNHWLAFMLDPAMASVLGYDFDSVSHSGIGLMTFRFVSLSIPYPIRTLAPARTQEQVRAIYEDRKLTQMVIHMEDLNEGLRRLALDEHPEWFDADAATRFLASPHLNVSRPAPLSIDPSLEAEIMQRERIVLDLFYPGDRQVSAA